MPRDIFGLHLGTDALEVMLLRMQSSGTPAVVSYGRVAHESVWAPNGQLQDASRLVESLKHALAAALPEPITTPYCVVSLPESQTFTTVFTLPAGLRVNEVRSTIPYKAEELLPFQTDEVYYDFKTIKRVGSGQEVLYAAAPASVVEGIRATLQQAGLQPVALAVQASSAALSVVDTTKAPTLLMDVELQTASLHIVDETGIRMSRRVSAPARKSAASTKPLVAKSTTRRSAGPTARWITKVAAEATALCAEYETQSHHPVQQGVLVGSVALIEGSDKRFGEALRISVAVGNPLARLEGAALPELRAQAVLFAPVVGLALRGLYRSPEYDDINLLPLEPQSRVLPSRSDAQAWGRLRRLIMVAGALMLLLAVVLGLRSQGVDVFRVALNSLFGWRVQTSYSPRPIAPVEPAPIVEPASDEVDGTASSTPTAEPLGEEGRDIFKPEVKVKVLPNDLGYLNVREGPGTTFAKVGQVQIGEEFAWLEDSGSWVKIDLTGGKQGWVNVDYIEKIQ